jgi:hypothetical protein
LEFLHNIIIADQNFNTTLYSELNSESNKIEI